MDLDLSSLDDWLATEGLDGYLIRAPGDDPDQRYLTGFPGPDSFVSLYADGALHLLVRGLDRGLARRESRASSVTGGADYDRRELIAEHGETEADRRIIARFLEDYGVSSVAVPSDFPLATADGLREMDVTVQADHHDQIGDLRAIKSNEEIGHIERTQRATERAMGRAEDVLREATIDDGVLQYESAPLTSERLKEEIELTLVRNRCITEETIVAGGADGAAPHHRGAGPLPAGNPIVIDIFPRHRESKYYADMTRTFCVDEPSDTARDWYDLTRRAQRAAIDHLEPGVSGGSVHDVVCDIYESAGFDTVRANETAETGYIHGTGHGVGLDVHERPRLSTDGGELKPGHVVTVEPGLYDPKVGGIRIEDLVVITEDGARNLTDYPREFVV